MNTLLVCVCNCYNQLFIVLVSMVYRHPFNILAHSMLLVGMSFLISKVHWNIRIHGSQGTCASIECSISPCFLLFVIINLYSCIVWDSEGDDFGLIPNSWWSAAGWTVTSICQGILCTLQECLYSRWEFLLPEFLILVQHVGFTCNGSRL